MTRVPLVRLPTMEQTPPSWPDSKTFFMPSLVYQLVYKLVYKLVYVYSL